MATSFKNPLFRLNRHYERSDHKLTEGLGVRLSSTLLPDLQTPTPINRKSPKDKIVETVLAKFKSEKIAGPDREEKLKELKTLLQEELVKIDSNLSVDISHDKQETNYDYLEMMMGMEEDSSIQEWVDSILTATVDSSVWNAQSSSPFYDGAKEIKHPDDADKMSIRVQYLLAEINFYCKTNKLSEANFGEFFDKEPHATEIAKRVKEGLVQGEDIEPIIYNYINSNHTELGLGSPLITKQQKKSPINLLSITIPLRTPHILMSFLSLTPIKKEIYLPIRADSVAISLISLPDKLTPNIFWVNLKVT